MEKFKVWDTRAFTELYGLVEQIESTIVKLVEEGLVNNLSQLPPSLVPTASLYQLCIAYKLLYDELLEKNLLEVGSKQVTNLLH